MKYFILVITFSIFIGPMAGASDKCLAMGVRCVSCCMNNVDPERDDCEKICRGHNENETG